MKYSFKGNIVYSWRNALDGFRAAAFRIKSHYRGCSSRVTHLYQNGTAWHGFFVVVSVHVEITDRMAEFDNIAKTLSQTNLKSYNKIKIPSSFPNHKAAK